VLREKGRSRASGCPGRRDFGEWWLRFENSSRGSIAPLRSARVGAARCFESIAIYVLALIPLHRFLSHVHGPYPNMTSRSKSFRWFAILLIGLACACVLFMAVPARAQVWPAIGPAGGDVRALASDPGHPEVLYLGTTDGAIFTSHDAGADWEPLGVIGGNQNAVVTAILVDPPNSARLYASTWTREARGEGGGVFLSSDGGATWRESGLMGHAVRALAQAASDPEMLVAGGLDGVFLSRDSGESWQRITPAGDAELRNFDSLAIDPRDSQIIYAGTFHLPWKTTDGGAHWNAIHAGMIDDSDVLSLVTDRENPLRIFASACSGIYRSDDGGAAWEKLEGIPYSARRTPVIRQDVARPVILYAGTTEGLWKTADGGASWRRISPRSWVINSMVILPGAGGESRVLLGTERQGVLASDDGGAKFHAWNEGFHHYRIVSLAVDAQDPERAAAVLENAPDALLMTEDGGKSWVPMGAGLDGEAARQIFSSPASWWVALAAGGLARFDAQRNSWERIGVVSESSSSRLNSAGDSAGGRSEIRAFRPAVNDIFFGDSAWFAATEQGLFVSRDSGRSWTELPFGPGELPVGSVRASRDGQRIRLVSSGGMIFSEDAGRTWAWHDLPLESGGAVRLEWASENGLLAAARAGLYISRDAGVSWTKAQAGLPGGLADGMVTRPEFWLVSMQTAGLYISRDQGATWTRVKRSGSTVAARGSVGQFPVLVAGGAAQRIYAGSSNDGLFRLDLSGNAAPKSFATDATTATGGH
jgi:photosystem II stability/assembly factor-like uncharacterized protein